MLQAKFLCELIRSQRALLAAAGMFLLESWSGVVLPRML